MQLARDLLTHLLEATPFAPNLLVDQLEYLLPAHPRRFLVADGCQALSELSGKLNRFVRPGSVGRSLQAARKLSRLRRSLSRAARPRPFFFRCFGDRRVSFDGR